MPMQSTSYLLLGILRITFSADSRETSCSLETPPKITATLVFAMWITSFLPMNSGHAAAISETSCSPCHCFYYIIFTYRFRTEPPKLLRIFRVCALLFPLQMHIKLHTVYKRADCYKFYFSIIHRNLQAFFVKKAENHIFFERRMQNAKSFPANSISKKLNSAHLQKNSKKALTFGKQCVILVSPLHMGVIFLRTFRMHAG